jgi:hypothetical protein
MFRKIFPQRHPSETLLEVSKLDVHVSQKIALRPIAWAPPAQCLHQHFVFEYIEGVKKLLPGYPTP